MPKKKLEYVKGGLYHVGARSNNREWFYVPLDVLWEVFLEVYQRVSIDYHAHLVAFVLMSNHYHLLIETPEGNLGAIMNYVQREVSRAVGSISGRINHIFGATYKGSLIKSEEYLFNAYRYVYQNPVQAKVCEKVDEYCYSTLQFLLKGVSPIALSDNIACERAPIPKPLPDRLRWLNEVLSVEQNSLIQRALRKAECDYPKKNGLKKLIKSLSTDAKSPYGK